MRDTLNSAISAAHLLPTR